MNNLENALNNFIDDEEEVQTTINSGSKKVIIDSREGLIERVDKIFVTKDGKQLLREQY